MRASFRGEPIYWNESDFPSLYEDHLGRTDSLEWIRFSNAVSERSIYDEPIHWNESDFPLGGPF